MTLTSVNRMTSRSVFDIQKRRVAVRRHTYLGFTDVIIFTNQSVMEAKSGLGLISETAESQYGSHNLNRYRKSPGVPSIERQYHIKSQLVSRYHYMMRLPEHLIIAGNEQTNRVARVLVTP